MNLYNIVFSQPVEFKIHTEVEYIIKNLHCEAIDALGRMKNKNKDKITECVKGLDEVFNATLKLYDKKCKTDEKPWENIQVQIIELIERLYNKIKGKYMVQIIKVEKDNFLDSLKNFIGMVNKSITLIFFVDISKLNILHEQEIKDFIEIKEYLQHQGIELSLVADGGGSRKIKNFFDSIKPLEDFTVFASEIDAVLGLSHEENCFNRIIKRIKDVEHE